MRSSFLSALAIVLASSSTALANLYVTAPVATTKVVASQNFIITWTPQNTTKPLATDFGPTTVSLMTGSQTTQFVLQTFGTLQDPSQTVKVVAKIDPTVGENSDKYFVRFQSVSAKDAAGDPLQAFSARFNLKGMTGNFTRAMTSANVQATGSVVTSSVSATATAGLATGLSVVGNSTLRGAIQTAGSSTSLPTSTRSALNATGTTSATSGAAPRRMFNWRASGTMLAVVSGIVLLLA